MEYKTIIKINPRFNGVYSRSNLTKIKYWSHVINLEEYKSIGAHWIALYVNDKATYFYCFGVGHISKEIKQFYASEISNIFRIHAFDSIMCRYFWIRSIGFISKGISLLEYTKLFSPDEY